MASDALFVAILLFLVGLSCIPFSRRIAGYFVSAALLSMVAGLLMAWCAAP